LVVTSNKPLLKLITEYSNLGSSSQGIAGRYVLIIGYEKDKIGVLEVRKKYDK